MEEAANSLGSLRAKEVDKNSGTYGEGMEKNMPNRRPCSPGSSGQKQAQPELKKTTLSSIRPQILYGSAQACTRHRQRSFHLGTDFAVLQGIVSGFQGSDILQKNCFARRFLHVLSYKRLELELQIYSIFGQSPLIISQICSR